MRTSLSAVLHQTKIKEREALRNQPREELQVYTLEEMHDRKVKARELLLDSGKYSDMMREDQEFLKSYFSVSEEEMIGQERKGVSASDSVVYAHISHEYNIELNRLNSNRTTDEDRKTLWAELDGIYTAIAPELREQAPAQNLIAYVVDDQLTSKQALQIYSISRALDVCLLKKCTAIH
ncbi:MAG: hypothetical protein K0S22_2096 [Oscillospiraceae bacterium]|jgi:hypothetical protein|nr:hypothetical protein [Oscillospiraceae bacterium]